MRRPHFRFLFFFCCLIFSMLLIPFSISLQDNYSLSFDGTDDYAECGPSQLFKLQNLTIESWIKPKYNIQPGSNALYGHSFGSVVSRGPGGFAWAGWALQFDYESGALYFRFVPAGYVYPVNYHSNRAVWYNNTWYHITVTYDRTLPNGNVKFYVNGTFDSQQDEHNIISNGDNPLQIGCLEGTNAFGGLIDEVRIWNVSRTQTDVQGAVSRILSAAEAANPSLVGYWRFDEGTGTNSKDCSQYGNDAVLSSSPTNPQWTSSGGPISYDLSFLQLTITATVGGTTSPRPGNYTHVNGTTVKVQAIPDAEYTFSYWTLDGVNAGSANPISVTMGANCTLQAVFAQQEPEPSKNYTLSYDGKNDYVSCGKSQIFRQQDLTIEAWIKPTFNVQQGSNSLYGHQWGSIVNCRGPGWFFGFDYTRGLLYFIIDSPYVEYHFNRAVWYNNTWYHVAVTYDKDLPSDNLNFYVNGTPDGKFNDKRSISYGDAALQIGAEVSAGHFFGGLIDEVRVWNVSRTQTDIGSTMLRILSTGEAAYPNLVGYWRFDEGTGTNSKDYSKYGNDAVLAASPANPQWASPGSPITYQLSTCQLTIATTTDGTTNPVSGNYTFIIGTILSVRAIPNAGYILSCWKFDDANSGVANPITITMNSNHTLQAVFSAAALQPGLVGYWKFAEGAGTAAYDSSGNGNNGTLHNGLAWVDGKYDKALSFNGVDNYVEITENLIKNNVTLSISAWFETASHGVIIGYQDTEYPAVPGYYVPIIYVGADGKLRGEFWTGVNSPITTTFNVNDGNWHYAALVGNTNTQSLYVDGNLVGTLSGTINHLDMSKNYIGVSYWDRWPSSSGNWGFFNGKIDEVRIYHRALSQQEVKADMGELGTSSNNSGDVLSFPVLPWPLSLILYGSMVIAAISLGGFTTRRIYRKWRIAKRTEWSKEMAKVEDLRREGEFAKVAKLCANAFLKSLKRKSEEEAAYSIQRYFNAARTLICQAALKNDKKALESVGNTQNALRRNKAASKSPYTVHISKIDSMLEKVRINDLDFIIDVAAGDDVITESLSKILGAQNEMEVKEVAKQMGYTLETTQKLLSKSIKRNKIGGFITLDGQKFMARDSLKTKLKAEIDEGLDDWAEHEN